MKNLLLPQVIECERMMAAGLDKSESSLKAIEEKEQLNKSLSSIVVLEQRLLRLTNELEEERAKNSSVGLEEGMKKKQ
ncbi:hypothetical protein K435DRAFT_787541, partial [Dendrothele bispora CBS 962.96]